MKHKFFTSMLFAAALCGCSSTKNGGDAKAPQLALAKDGKTEYTIIYEFKGDTLLDPSVRDLAATLKEITGAEFPVKAEAAGPKIYIGKTAPGDTAAFQSRERRIKNAGRDLYIYGDYRFGTAAAIYNFLTKFCGCRWYTASGVNRIPKNPNLSFQSIDYSHVPSFKSLEHGSRSRAAEFTTEIRDWVRRNNSFLMPNYAFGAPDDAWNYIGPVTHTLAAYIPPIARKPRSFNADTTFFAGPHPCLADKRYFETNPEYFTLSKEGKRVADKQVCFSNPVVRKLLLENVEKVIKAEKYDPAQYAVLDFTQNDRSGGFCFCENCRKLEEKYKTPGGAYFDFLDEMGKHFIKKYPKLLFRFFAYQEDMTGIPPKGLVFPDNMSVIIAPLQQDFSKPFTHEYNIRFLNQMRDWGKICKEIWLWNYPTLYPHGMIFYSLFPGVYRNTENLKLAYEAGVRYIIAEQGGGVNHFCSFKELNVYLQDLMAEDVNIDVDAAIKEFCDAVYGKASKGIQKYLKETDAACKKDPGYFRYYYDPRVMARVVHAPQNLIKWQRDFAAMEELVKDDPSALFNVRRARMNLDSITILCYNECAKFDKAFAEAEPLDKIYKRYRKYVREDAEAEFKTYTQSNKKALIDEHTASFTDAARMAYGNASRSGKQHYPKALIAKYGRKNLFSLMPGQSRRAPAKWDDKAAFGFSVRIPRPTPDVYIVIQHIAVGKKDGLPWNNTELVKPRDSFLTAEDLAKIDKSKGFTPIWIGRDKLSPAGALQLATLPSRNAKFFLGELYDPENPEQKYDFYLSLKDGGDKGKTLLVDRLILAKVAGDGK